jgi:hypothetical protein
MLVRNEYDHYHSETLNDFDSLKCSVRLLIDEG